MKSGNEDGSILVDGAKYGVGVTIGIACVSDEFTWQTELAGPAECKVLSGSSTEAGWHLKDDIDEFKTWSNRDLCYG